MACYNPSQELDQKVSDSILWRIEFCRTKKRVLFMWSTSVMLEHPFYTIIRIHAEVQEVISISEPLYYSISIFLSCDSTIIEQKVLCLIKFQWKYSNTKKSNTEIWYHLKHKNIRLQYELSTWVVPKCIKENEDFLKRCLGTQRKKKNLC